MKKLLIAASILSSLSAMANPAAQTLSFTTTSNLVKQCTLGYVNHEAKIEFLGDGDDRDHASISLTTNLVNTIKVKGSSSWIDVSSWGGNIPETVFEVSYTNRYGNHREKLTNVYDFEHDVSANSGSDVENTFYFYVKAEKPTHIGSGRLDMTVQIECE